uniref:NADH dehydrogenase subunit 6 n=1 Tax=Thulinius sp. DVL-2010 TaxID=867920 RepID=F8RJC0_9BILA|nr:NADH dehydrogenase subunit 6 [Thulinius sp. DVL-2010]ADK97602.1 NADH dehydrogenase subunit 6 [Thulinius sp. DVL-2010]
MLFMTTLFSLTALIVLTASTHPLILVCAMIFQTTTFFCYSYLITPTSWMAFIIFLVMVGGLLIVFSYLSALVPNEMFIFKLKYLNLLSIFILTTMLNSQFFTSKITMSEFAFKFSQFQLLKMVTLMFIYFLIVMFMVMFMTSFLKAPLKTKIT